MALNSYSALKTSIVTWAMRTGDDEFSAQTGDFITLAEKRLNRVMRVADMEAVSSIALTNGEGDLPSDYLEFRQVKGANGSNLQLATQDWILQKYGASPVDIPYVSITGTRIKSYASSSSPLSLSYYATIPALSNTVTTNWLLNKAPELYLYAALLESAPYMMDDARATTWGKMLELAVKDYINADKAARYSRISVRVAGATP